MSSVIPEGQEITQAHSETYSPGWQVLSLVEANKSQPSCPKLFYHFTTTTTASAHCITILLTDLIGIWASTLDNSDILEYVSEHKTSIDPTHSRSQFSVLLQRLAESLKKGKNTLRQIEYNTKLDTDADEALLLETRLDLPLPLKPLVWTFSLLPQPAAVISQHILRPCLSEAATSGAKLASLQEIVKTKDHVISRLLDKIEASKMDLSLIFPGITGARARKGATTIKEAKRHVAGLAAFEPEKWAASFEYLSAENERLNFEQKGLGNLISGLVSCPTHDEEGHERWLDRLDKVDFDSINASQLADTDDAGKAFAVSESDSDKTASETEDEDESAGKVAPSVSQPHSIADDVPSMKVDIDQSSESDFESDPRSTKQAKQSPSPSKAPSSPLLPPLPAQPSNSSPPSSPSSLNARYHPTPRLGRLGAQPLSATKPPPSNKRKQTFSSSPLPAPELSSDPPPAPNKTTNDAPSTSARKKVDSRANGRFGSSDAASSPTTASSNTNNHSSTPSTPHRLGRLRKTIPSSPLKSQIIHSPDQTNTIIDANSPTAKTKRQDTNRTSEPPTPTRRLGRLKSKSQFESQSQSQLQSSQPLFRHLDSIRETTHPTDPDETVLADNDDDDLDALLSKKNTRPPRSSSSSSTSSSRQGSPSPKAVKTDSTQQEVRPPTPEPDLTAEEKAALRREELKRKVAPAAGGGLRKKRKF